MHIVVNKKNLEACLNLCSSYADKKDSSDIRSHFLLEAKANKGLIIKANNLEIGINYTLSKIELKEEGIACVNAKKLLDSVKVLKNDNLSLELKNNDLLVKQGRTKFKLAMFDIQDFPSFPSLENKKDLNINSDDLIRYLNKILPPINVNHPLHILRGAYIDVKEDKVNFVSTDSNRLALLSLEQKSKDIFSLDIPKKAITAMKDLFFEDKNINIYYADEVLIATSPKFDFYTKLINASNDFPNYENIIPKSFNHTFIFKTEDFKNSLKIISSISEQVKLGFFKNKLVFTSKKEEKQAEVQTELEIELNLEESFELSFKINYLSDFLNTIEEEEFNFQLNSPELFFQISQGDLKTIIAPTLI